MENIEIKRHSLAHILAEAVEEIYGKQNVKLGFGPAIENGFYHDFDLGDIKISDGDLKNIEKKMKNIISQNQKIEKYELEIDEAIKKYKGVDEYRTENLETLKKQGETKVSFYKNINQKGEIAFENLCSGPHLENTNKIDKNTFCLEKVAGAYWLGDENNPMLTRIYGFAFNTQEELKNHLKMIEEAKKRDHRILGKKMDIFSFSENVGLGLPLWHPMGGRLWRAIEDFWIDEHIKGGYEFVRTPHIGNQKLWETSGHWGFYSDSMYPPLEVGQNLEDSQLGKKINKENSEKYLLKPMNCPFHVEIYNNSPKSYRDLPLRWAELGTVYRFEKRGQLGGLTRVRGFTQDDAHIFCTKEQVKSEITRVVEFIDFIVKSFGLDYQAYLSFRDPKSDKYVGDDEMWELSQKVLKEVSEEKGLNAPIEEGEAAFYGAKIDFKIKDSLGREHQCSTVQFDFNLPERFDINFTNSEGKEEKPYVIHRALLGSFERFISILIENYAGVFPLWFAPRQVVIIPINEKFDNYAKKINDELKENKLRSEIDFSSDSLNKKVRNAEKMHINYILIVGEEEEKNETVSVRNYKTKEKNVENLDNFIKKINIEILDKKI